MITYQKEITKLYKSLNSNSQFKLWNKIQDGDSNARNQVINSCLPLAFKLADKFHKNNKHIDLEDLMGEANLALINAVDKWDINKSNITTIATHCIKNALINTIHDSKYNIRFPVSFSRRAADQLYKVIGSTKQLAEEIAADKKIGVNKVKALMQYAHKRRFDVSDIDIEEKNDEVPKYCVKDLENLMKDNLDDVEFNLMSQYFGFFGEKKKTVRQICNQEQMIEQDVRQLINSCKKKLKQLAMENVDV